MKFDRTTIAAEVVQGIDLTGRSALVTGGGAGIGHATACALALAGAHVCIADINEGDSRAAVDRFVSAHPASKVDFMRLDLGSLDTVRRFAAEFSAREPRLDILVNNAGIMACPEARTPEGHELQFGVNFLGHYLLTRLLKPQLTAAGKARLVSLSSIGHKRSDIVYDDIDFLKRPYERWQAYGQSKTGCALLAVAVDRLWRDAGVRANTMNPGGSFTGLHRHMTDDERRRLGFLDENNRMPDRWRTPEQCAATSVWLACSPDLEGVGGKYFEGFAESAPWREDDPMKGVHPYAIDPENAQRLWSVAAAMVGLPDTA